MHDIAEFIDWLNLSLSLGCYGCAWSFSRTHH